MFFAKPKARKWKVCLPTDVSLVLRLLKDMTVHKQRNENVARKMSGNGTVNCGVKLCRRVRLIFASSSKYFFPSNRSRVLLCSPSTLHPYHLNLGQQLLRDNRTTVFVIIIILLFTEMHLGVLTQYV